MRVRLLPHATSTRFLVVLWQHVCPSTADTANVLAVILPSPPPHSMPPKINTNASYKEAISQIFGRPPIYDAIFSCLTPLALARMASTSRAIRSATRDFQRRAYNINKRLKRYFSNPQSFRSLMARTDMVISGSFALQFFDRSFYPESDLDLYVYYNEKLHEIASHLLKEGYTFKPAGEQIADSLKEIEYIDRKSTRLNSSHSGESRMPSSA